MQIDTIAAVSTAPGIGAIAVVRISGPDAHALLVRLAREAGALPPARVATLVQLHDPDDGEVLDHALVTRFDAPASYTGEDMVEMACHGGWLVPGLILDACLRAGAREAEAGELTRRAYLNGKLDLVQVEAVADVIEARSRALHRAAIGQLDKGLSRRVAELRSALVGLEALLAHHIDFPEEDEPPVPLSRIEGEAEAVVERLDRLLATAPEGELLREGAVTVLAGRPNVGKSSLFNALLGEARAIVTEIPGTTRDAVEAVVQIGGFPFRLVDTAGVRETDETVERLGIETTRRYLAGADVVLLCVDAPGPLSEGEQAFLEELNGRPVVLVQTKADLAGGKFDLGADGADAATKVRVSARTGDGLDALRDALCGLVFGRLSGAGPEAPVLTRRRHARALSVARSEVAAFRDALREGLPAEVAAAHLRPAATALEEVLGVISVDDVLDVVFRDFCVGK